MGYNPDNFRKIKEEYTAKRLRAEAEAESRRSLLHGKNPDIAAIDEALAGTGLRLFRVSCQRGGEEAKKQIAAIKEENLALQKKRAALLDALGLAADYTEPRYECKLCRDSGYVETRMCDCMRRCLVLAGFRSSGLGTLIDRQSFENFDLSYYKDDAKEFENMQENLRTCREFAEQFSPNSGNLLLTGKTGLGKTHLSTAIARKVIEAGYDVLYESAQNILADYEHDRFHAGYGDTAPRAQKYLDCDLLIMDDLGTELTNQFTISCLYNLLNMRLNRGLSTVINTNLDPSQLLTRYEDRIASRLFGEFHACKFLGNDVRMKKLLG